MQNLLVNRKKAYTVTLSFSKPTAVRKRMIKTYYQTYYLINFSKFGGRNYYQ